VSALIPAAAAQAVLLSVVFLTGAAIGSFLNVVIYRLPRRESLVRPRSRCLSCGESLGFVDLIPVLSYIVLGGRCRHCRRRYSPRYMLVELASGLAALGAWHLFGPTLHALLAFVAFSCLTVVFCIDLDHLIIPDEAVLIIAGCGVLLDLMDLLQRGRAAAVVFDERLSAGLQYHVMLPKSLVGMVVGAGLFWAIAVIAERVFRRPGMGLGDVKLAAGMGAVLGPGYQFLAYFLVAVVIGAVVGLVCMVLGRCGRGDYIPFGPMMAVAGLAMIYFGDVVTPWVMSRFLAA